VVLQCVKLGSIRLTQIETSNESLTSDMSSCPAGVPLIAVNPFQNVSELYDSKMVNRYKSDSVVEIKV